MPVNTEIKAIEEGILNKADVMIWPSSVIWLGVEM